MIFVYPTFAHVIDDKLEQRIKTHLFLEFDFGVNDYWLWFVEPSSTNLLINRIVEFYVEKGSW